METNTATATPIGSAPKASKVRKVTKGAKKVTKVTKSPEGKIALKTICGQLKIEPRLARRKLRNADLSWHDSRDRWTFSPTQATKVKEILRA